MGKGGFPAADSAAEICNKFETGAKMQADMQRAQEELKNSEVTGSAAGGMVEITMTGDKEVTAVKIKPEAVDPNDIEMLEDLIVASFNDAVKKVDELQEELMGPLAGGMGGLF